MVKRAVAGVILGGVLFAGAARGAVPFKEDLQGCKLPHGEVTIPVSGAAPAGKGDLLKIADASFAPVPQSPDKPQSRAELAAILRAKNTADLAFLSDDEGTLWAISGRIVDVGTSYLYEVAAMKLDRPALIPENAKRPAGLLRGVQEGRTFLVETADGHFALLRVLEIGKAGLTAQYVYQPSGQARFEIPQGQLLEPGEVPLKPMQDPGSAAVIPPPLPATAPATVPAPTVIGATGPPGQLVLHIGGPAGSSASPATAPNVLEPYLSTHLAQRDLLIQTRLKILQAPAKTPAEIDKKIQAINDLVALHADQAAEVLVSQITFINPRGVGKESEFQDGVHPCFAALKRLGKPASSAAVKALRQLDLSSPTQDDILQSASYRAGLLALVIRAVEGDVVGEFILRQEHDATTDAARRALYEQLINPVK